MEQTDFKSKSYKAHEEHVITENEMLLARLECKDEVVNWRMDQINYLLTPLIEDKSCTWLTVGDGGGLDALWLHKRNLNVLASDISDHVLKQAKALNYIPAISKENAENMSFKDSSFDYVLCKQAFHHFPRPYLGVYEMIRVCKKAAVLIEPQDIGIQFPYLIFFKNILDQMSPSFINKFWKNRFSFETVGNFVYKISEREVEKIAMGMGLPCVAFKGANDFYFSGFSDLEAGESKVKFLVKMKNFFSKLRLLPFQHLSCIIYKEKPSPSQLNTLKKEGYKVVMLPKNPYINN